MNDTDRRAIASGHFDALVRWAGDELALGPGITLLEFGIGKYGFGTHYAEQCARVIGLDLHDWSALHPGVEFIAYDGVTIPLPGSSVDVVASHSVLEHVDDIEASLSEIDRILRPGGRAFLSVCPLYFSAGGHHILVDGARIENWEHLTPGNAHFGVVNPIGDGQSKGHFLNKLTISEFLAAVGCQPWDVLKFERRYDAGVPLRGLVVNDANPLDLITREFRFLGKKNRAKPTVVGHSRSAPERPQPRVGVTNLDADLSQYDFLDFGCSTGDSMLFASRHLGGRRGLGLDIDPAKVERARGAGYSATVADVASIEFPKDAVRFVLISHFLEHLPSAATIDAALSSALRVASDFVFILGPYYDSEPALARAGFKLYWEDWHGHPYHLTVRELLDWAERNPAVAQRHVVLRRPITSSADPAVHPIDSPRDQVAYDVSLHPPKEIVDFDFPVFSEVACVLAKRPLDDWDEILRARPGHRAIQSVADLDALLGDAAAAPGARGVAGDIASQPARERIVADDPRLSLTDGVCAVCGFEGRFQEVSPGPLRESFRCPACRATLRYRHQVQVITELYGEWDGEAAGTLEALVEQPGFAERAVLEAAISGPIRDRLSRLSRYTGTYFWPERERGRRFERGLRNEDLQAMTFEDEQFDLVITSDVFEHVRRPLDAFREIRRVLKPGGCHVFTIPTYWPPALLSVSRVDTSGPEDKHVLPRHYHGCPTDSEGSLVYTDFGLDLLEQLRELGLPTTMVPGYRDNVTFVSERVDTAAASAEDDTAVPATLTTKPGVKPTAQVTLLDENGEPIAATPDADGVPACNAEARLTLRRAASVPRASPAPAPTCNICGGTRFAPGPYGRLATTGVAPRCARCWSLERHRMLRRAWNALDREWLARLRALQISPDPSIDPSWFRSHELSIFGTDNSVDLQAIDRADASYDVVVCNHVLEHVADDRAAIRELMRVLAPDGFLELTLPNPIARAVTEDWGHPKPEQHGHYRVYGADIVERVREAAPGTAVLLIRATDRVTHVDDYVYFWSASRDTIARLRKRLGTFPIVRDFD